MNKRSLIKNTNALPDVVGIIIMVSIAVAVAATINVTMQHSASTQLNKIPIVGTLPSDEGVVVTTIQNGPVRIDGITVVIEDKFGNHVGSASFTSADAYLRGGDIITISGVTPKQVYTVSLVYLNNIISITTYSSH